MHLYMQNIGRHVKLLFLSTKKHLDEAKASQGHHYLPRTFVESIKMQKGGRAGWKILDAEAII